MRTTIDYGIDLGTTNSAIAVLTNTSTEIIKNADKQADLTPSVVWIDRKGTVHVGEDAKSKLGRESETVAFEFKRKMGTSSEVFFEKTNRKLKPEELSAEVLKALKNNIKNRFNEDISAAAITVPAAFEMPQCEATQRAARLAGINLCPLLQEPVAASLAYGFQGKDDEKEIWLVYDLGGGTFDTALMQMRDGIIQVLAHKGDNHLGGGLIDDAIVEQILIPELISQYKLTDFRKIF
jgi:molecular chaperone DnaK